MFLSTWFQCLLCIQISWKGQTAVVVMHAASSQRRLEQWGRRADLHVAPTLHLNLFWRDSRWTALPWARRRSVGTPALTFTRGWSGLQRLNWKQELENEWGVMQLSLKMRKLKRYSQTVNIKYSHFDFPCWHETMNYLSFIDIPLHCHSVTRQATILHPVQKCNKSMFPAQQIVMTYLGANGKAITWHIKIKSNLRLYLSNMSGCKHYINASSYLGVPFKSAK